MSFIQINNNYLVGAVNLLIVTLLAGVIGILLILQVKAYELNVSYAFSYDFFFYDPFASRLILICLLALVINSISATINMSGLFSHPIESNSVIFSMCSILWIVIYLAVDYIFEVPGIAPLALLILVLIALLSQQLGRLRTKLVLYSISLIVVVLPIITRLTE